MTTYDNQRDPQRDDHGSFSSHFNALIPGLVLVGVGALILLGNLHIVHVTDWFAYWPAILIAVGLVQLVDGRYLGQRIAGGVLAGAGAVWLADNLGYISFRVEDLWPLGLIAAGLFMLWSRATGRGIGTLSGYQRRWGHRPPWGGVYTGAVNECAIFGGSHRVVTDQDFKGGKVCCVFGGMNLDLTGAAMEGNTAVIELATIYGGATIRVPLSWNVEVRGAGIFGGFSDRTVHPAPSPDMKHLIIRGAAFFGGVNIKN